MSGTEQGGAGNYTGVARRESTEPDEPRPIARRRPVAGTRAVVGGLLVTLAMVGTFATYSRDTAPPADRVLVLRRDVRAGETLSAEDVDEDRADLPEAVRAAALDSEADVGGAVALAPLHAGELLQRSAVLLAAAAGSANGSSREFSLPVERDRALNGEIARGETVDVLATYGTGESAYTVTVARRATVIDVAETSGGLGSDGRIVVTVALQDADTVLRATHASVAAVVTLVRSTRAPQDDGADRYSTAEDHEDGR